MQMLQENESRKKVSLFVTRQRIAVMSPTKSNKERKKGTKKKQHLNVIHTEAQYADEIDQQHDNEIDEAPGDEVTIRKKTVLTHVWNLPEHKRIVVKCNQLGQPIGKEGGLLGQFLGTIARNGGYCPIDVNDWRKVKKDSAETILQCIQTKFLYPRSCEKWILKSIGRDWRKYKATLKKNLFNPKKKRSTLYKLCPSDIDEDQWKGIIRYWKSTEGKNLSEKNKTSRKMKKTTHTGGTKSFARWFEDLVQLENIIDKQPELAQNSEGRVAWEGDALQQVLGKEKPGQVHGMGLLPVSNQVYGRTTRHFKDINIATIDGSSSDVETHMLEEIKQLKEHARNQDKRIDELVNKKRHDKDEEPSKVGSTVLLKTANYRNKATVAYATILSSSPKADVGGVEIGKQFYKVRINHPIEKDEPLVRPIAGYKTIGDAHAKGIPIAWPSVCVCYH
ncbi:hypothetical protein HU200_034586 [Digitaria exilis]|uniref:Transposase Tnp1/En/Spm-like domain-containing protein n=1 Tax=Digitaria exilis TaxID=1010633 RepID=A0A835BJU7_9POAL|nr:hypothetical protein HU200_034586 [Digitaria exilis]